MQFKGRRKSFSLKINGYEFERSEFEEDLDWLDVQVEVSDGDLIWVKNGPFVRTEELEEILQLLQSVKEGNVSFLEDDLSFGIKDNLFAVHMKYSLHPRGDSYHADSDSEYVLNFILNKAQKDKAISEVKKWMKLFPIRAKLLE